jgi:hypothetical protein
MEESPKTRSGGEKLFHNHYTVRRTRLSEQRTGCTDAAAREFVSVSKNTANPGVQTGKSEWPPCSQFYLAMLHDEACSFHFDPPEKELCRGLSVAGLLQPIQATRRVKKKNTQWRARHLSSVRVVPVRHDV